MTERVIPKTPFGCSSQTGLLRQAIRATLLSTALGVGGEGTVTVGPEWRITGRAIQDAREVRPLTFICQGFDQ